MLDDVAKAKEEGLNAGDALSYASRYLVRSTQSIDRLRKFVVWNVVGVVKILKKRRKFLVKQCNFDLGRDPDIERDTWLRKQAFYSGS